MNGVDNKEDDVHILPGNGKREMTQKVTQWSPGVNLIKS